MAFIDGEIDTVTLLQVGRLRLAVKDRDAQDNALIRYHHEHGVDQAVIDLRTQEDNTMRRRERTVVLIERLRHTERGPVTLRTYLAKQPDGSYAFTDVAHEAAVWTDAVEAVAIAARAQRELGGNWRAAATKTLGFTAGQWHQLEASGNDVTLELSLEL